MFSDEEVRRRKDLADRKQRLHEEVLSKMDELIPLLLQPDYVCGIEDNDTYAIKLMNDSLVRKLKCYFAAKQVLKGWGKRS